MFIYIYQSSAFFEKIFLFILWDFHTLYLITPSYPSPSSWQIHQLPYSPSPCFQKLEPIASNFHCPNTLSYMWSQRLKSCWSTRDHTLKESWLSVSQQLSVTNSSSARGGILCPHPCFMVNLHPDRACTGLVHVVRHRNYYAFMWAAVLSRPGNGVVVGVSTSGCYSRSAFSSTLISEPCLEGCAMSCLGLSIW